MEDTLTKKYEIIDGQQRPTALRDFREGKFKLLHIGEKSKLRIPKSMRDTSHPGRESTLLISLKSCRSGWNRPRSSFSLLGPTLSPTRYEIFLFASSQEQPSRGSRYEMLGQATWDHSLSVLRENWTSMLRTSCSPSLTSEDSADDEEQRDYHVADRQTCAQLLKIFLARERDPYRFPVCPPMSLTHSTMSTPTSIPTVPLEAVSNSLFHSGRCL